MNKVLITGIAAILGAIPAIAQKSNVTSSWMYLKHNQLDLAKNAIDQAMSNAESKDDPKTWLYAGNVYSAISNSKDEKFSALNNTPDSLAISDWAKTVSLDTKGKFPEVYDSLNNIAIRELNKGVSYLHSNDYNKALTYLNNFFSAYKGLGDKNKSLELTLAKNSLSIDDIKLLAASTAFNANQLQTAKNLYQQLIDAGSTKPEVYTNMADLYKSEKDTAKALQVLQNGLAKVKDNQSPLILSELNTYIQMGESQKAIDLSQKAIAADPKNTSIYVAIGNIYDFQLKNYGEAQKLYKQALTIDSANYGANASMGFSMFNEGAAIYNNSIKEKDLNKSAALEKQAIASWKQAIPYLEHAIKIKPNSNDVLDTLARIYAQLGDKAKSDAYRARIKK